ncbi:MULTISPECIES: M949_RS01915 family surface polysaccharide biosynthesis protein [unclassified Mucilaginibacter]|uniref:M949_RS01915 family surface polysaccharide biosynthesis protein n=1 Tax=unclassified Mucilaginibacter TaxID=2617802 RepID=UPI002AC93B72|nr:MULTISPECIES: hypothetical protein [unclassified Mucilaginibacter]MEB0263062.1 hypothetical protein [Mucilaginibacter sp. 10I4]MEB0277527.1 hypothetical protein [Mucilaginibacter sp. 10B2]MEB0299442.1 hypothetical protein [Mucilaginibacter sp. 5C4]WPX24843.1 hypothetical protein RHM67_06135 [Mucilaginibacter sp. 5C4]
MKLCLLALLILTGFTAHAQVKVIKLGNGEIPKSITYKGHIIDVVKYTDADGEHLVITTETGKTPSKNSDSDGDGYRDAALYAYHYLVQTGSYKLTWSVYDFIKDCPVDIRANFIRKTFAVTDLDNNGKAEVWLMYRTVCHGDVGPSDMKIIMHEGNKKYAMRGENKVKVSEKDYIGGKYTFDSAFITAPTAFKLYAKNLWNKNLLENWDQ